MKIIDRFVWILSGEFLLHWYPNGGTVVLLRTVITSAVLYSLALITKGVLTTGWGTTIDLEYVRQLVVETLPWAGALLGGTYAAFYARFASQWTYLAEVYNHLMATQAQAPLDDNAERRRVYAYWKAGIIEDAYVLHLAGKPMFAPMVAKLLEEPEVVEAFRRSAVAADETLERLERILTKALGREVKACRDPQAPALIPAHSMIPVPQTEG